MALLGAGGRQRGAHAAVVVVVVMALTLAALARGTHAPPRHNNHDNHNNHPNHHSNKLGGSKGEASTAWRLVASSPSPVPLNDIVRREPREPAALARLPNQPSTSLARSFAGIRQWHLRGCWRLEYSRALE